MIDTPASTATMASDAWLLALSHWSLRHDFDPAWWAPNACLVVWPALCLCSVLPRAQGRPV